MFFQKRECDLFKRLLRGALVMIISACGVPDCLNAQDQSNFTHFFINPYVLNSSYAGLDGQPSASLIYRRQWMTIDGAPSITNLSIHAPVNTRLSAGININNDSKGFFNNSTLLLSAAYHLPVADHSFVRFGISAGGAWNTVDMDKLGDINDRALGNILDNNASLAGNAGVSFHHRTFNAGISLPTLFSPSYVSEDAFTIKEVKPFQNMVIHATNRFYFNHNRHIFEPYLLYYASTDLPSQVEVAGIVHLNHLVWAGASYRQHFGVSALGGVKLKNLLAIGASYSIKQSGVDELNSPSFEVSVNYLFGKHRRNAPVYSFVNAVKHKDRIQTHTAKNASGWRQKQIEAEQHRREEAAKLKAEQEEKRKQAAAAAAKKQQARTDAEANKKQPQVRGKEQANTRTEGPGPDQQTEATPVEEKGELEKPERHQALAEKETSAPVKDTPETEPEKRMDTETVREPVREETVQRQQPEAENVEPVLTVANEQPIVPGKAQADQLPSTQPPAILADNAGPQVEQKQEGEQQSPRQQADAPQPVATGSSRKPVRHETVDRGDHPEELHAAEYVIVGVFKSIENARHFAEGLRNLNYQASFGHLTEKALWYVHVLKTEDHQHARAEHQKLIKVFLFRDAWLLTVKP